MVEKEGLRHQAWPLWTTFHLLVRDCGVALDIQGKRELGYSWLCSSSLPSPARGHNSKTPGRQANEVARATDTLRWSPKENGVILSVNVHVTLTRWQHAYFCTATLVSEGDYWRTSKLTSRSKNNTSVGSAPSPLGKSLAPQGPDTPLFLTRPYCDATLVSGSLKRLVELPTFVDLNEWLAINGTHLKTFGTNVGKHTSFSTSSIHFTVFVRSSVQLLLVQPCLRMEMSSIIGRTQRERL